MVEELKLLAATPPERIETTLLVHPRVLTDFADHNDFLEIAEAALVALDLEGVIQIASFHPHYRFAGSEPDDIANATNRSPLSDPAPAARREHRARARHLRRPGFDLRSEHRDAGTARREGWAALQRQCRADAEREGS